MSFRQVIKKIVEFIIYDGKRKREIMKIQEPNH